MIASNRSSVFPSIPGFNSIISVLIGCVFSFFILFTHGADLLEAPSLITMIIIIFGALLCVSFIRISSLCIAAIQTPLIVVFCVTSYALLNLHAPLRQKLLTIAMQLAQYFPLIFTAFTLSVIYACFRWYFQYRRQYTESLGQKVMRTSQNIQQLSAPKRYPSAGNSPRSTQQGKTISDKTMAAYSTSNVPSPQRVNRSVKTHTTRTVVSASGMKRNPSSQMNNYPTMNDRSIRTKTIPKTPTQTVVNNRANSRRPRNAVINNPSTDQRNRSFPGESRLDHVTPRTNDSRKPTFQESHAPSAYLPIEPNDQRRPKRY